MSFDAVVVGLGVMGAAVLRSLATRGARVLGLDRHQPPHPFGSSHGRARMIREAYFEHPLYVPLVRRAYDLWEELEKESRVELLRITRGVLIGKRSGDLVTGALESAELHGIDVHLLSSEELGQAFPAFSEWPGGCAVLEPRAGYLRPAACVEALLDGARRHGAEIRVEEATGWRAVDGEVRVNTASARYSASALVLAAGPWLLELTEGLDLPLTVERVLQASFEPSRPRDCAPEALPVFVWEIEPGRLFYGFPAIDGAVKVGLHFGEQIRGPTAVARDVSRAESQRARELIRQFLPAADGPLLEADICFYTNTPDGHFLIDRHPGSDRVWIVSACSGHGFKFAPALGELVAGGCLGEAGDFDLDPFSRKRF